MKKKAIPSQGVFGKFDNFTGYVHHVLDKNDSVASASECTGLTPTPPENLDQEASYTDIVEIPLEGQ